MSVGGDLVPGSTRAGFSRETYRLEPLHCVLADVHPPGLLHLHMSQVLQGTEAGERVSDAVTKLYNNKLWEQTGYSNEPPDCLIPLVRWRR